MRARSALGSSSSRAPLRVAFLACASLACSSRVPIRTLAVDTSGEVRYRADDRVVTAPDPSVLRRARSVTLCADDRAEWRTTRRFLIGMALESFVGSLSLCDGSSFVRVGLPVGNRAYGVQHLVIVDVGADAVTTGVARRGLVASQDYLADEALAENATFLVRGSDDARFGLVRDVAARLERARPGRVILGALSADVAPPASEWLRCPFPPGNELAADDLVLRVELRSDGRAGIVDVERQPSRPLFASAGAFCASRQRFAPRGESRTRRLHVRFEQ